MENEEWKPVVGFEGLYEVSSSGRVKSLPRLVTHKGGHTQRVVGKILSAPVCGSGDYPTVHLWRSNRRTTRSVHSLVLEAFRGPAPKGWEGCHNDGNSLNNRLDNLRWDSRKANAADTAAHGARLWGERCHMAKLSEDDVRAIRADKRKQAEIAADYGIKQPTVSVIKSGKNWGWLA